MEKIQKQAEILEEEIAERQRAEETMKGYVREMEIAKDYVQHHFELADLEPPFDNTDHLLEDGSPRSGYRDPFELGAEVEVLSERVEGEGGPYRPGIDFAAMKRATTCGLPG